MFKKKPQSEYNTKPARCTAEYTNTTLIKTLDL